MTVALVLPAIFYISTVLNLLTLLIVMAVPAAILNTQWGKKELEKIGVKNFIR
jgi:hypothetical protein